MKKYLLAQDTISKKEIASLGKWLLQGEKLTKGKLTLKFENLFSNILIENIHYLLIVAHLQIY